MGTIVYSLSGEGRGHACRVRVMSRILAKDHRVIVLAPERAAAFLESGADGSRLSVIRVPGLTFSYRRNGELSPHRTAVGALGYLARLPVLVERIANLLVRERAVLAISDFEPSLPRAAALAGVPVLALDHQGFLLVSDLSWLPGHLRRWAAAVRPLVRWFCPVPAHRIVSSFYKPRLHRLRRPVSLVGVLLRDPLLRARGIPGRHLTAYLRRDVPESVLSALAGCGRPVRIYGLGNRPAVGALEFLPVSEEGFLESLLTCHALVTTAGNQLVGEALHLGKPVLALPEPGNQEQEINARFLERSNAGRWLPMERVNADVIRRFLEDAGALVPARGKLLPPGNDATLRVVEGILLGDRGSLDEGRAAPGMVPGMVQGGSV